MTSTMVGEPPYPPYIQATEYPTAFASVGSSPATCNLQESALDIGAMTFDMTCQRCGEIHMCYQTKTHLEGVRQAFSRERQAFAVGFNHSGGRERHRMSTAVETT